MKDGIEDLLSKVKQVRDEVKLKIHLGKAEARDEWDNLEEKWNELNAQSKPVLDAVDESAQEVGSALELLADELKRGYVRVKDTLKED